MQYPVEYILYGTELYFLRQGVSVRHLGAVVGRQMDMVELRHEMCKLTVRF